MGKTFEQVINRFDRGMVNDPRTPTEGYSRLLKNFEAHLFPHKLVPHRSSESADASASTSRKANFTFGVVSSMTRLYALGVAGIDKASVHYLTDPAGTTWNDPANNESSAGARATTFFIHYKNYIYGARAGTNFWRHGDITGSPSWTDSWQSVTYTNIAQGLVHSKDDILYIPYDNKIASFDNSTFTAAALTLPSDKVITSISEYGNYLAIATRPVSGVGKSVVYLWDLNASLPTLSESIDFGEGNIRIIEEIDGILVGVSVTPNNSFDDIIAFRYYAGGSTAQTFLQMVSDSTTVTPIPLAKMKKNNYLFFLMHIVIDGATHQGLWKLGRRTPGEPFSLTFDRSPNNDTAIDIANALNGFTFFGDYAFISYINASSAWALSKTDDQANYTATAILETTIQNGGDSGRSKKLIGVTTMMEALPTAGQVVLKYKKDEETSFTTIFTETTDSTIRRSEANFGFEFKEITFRVESTGGAAITGIRYKYEFVEDDAY